MSASDYFRNAADYHDWWRFSNTALGGFSAGETFKLMHEQLSDAGANTLIVLRFLEENERGIDVQLWRRAFVFGHVGLQVSLTLKALQAIGAQGVAEALRTAPPQQSIFSRAQELVQSGNPAGGEAADMIKSLRENMAVGLSHVLGEVPSELQAAIPQPKATEGAETHAAVLRLLDAYVAAHAEALARDVAKHGDPRKQPGFEPQEAKEERARLVDRLGFLRYQRNAIDGLREQLAKLKARAARESSGSPRLNKPLRRLLDDYEGLAKHPPEDLTPEVEAWLREVEQFRDAHPEALAPKACSDDRVNARLAELGPYEVSFDFDTPSICWDEPASLPSDWAPFDLSFRVIDRGRPDPARVAAALDALCDEWGRYQPRWPKLRQALADYVVDFFRNFLANYLPDEECEPYRDDDGELAADKILAGVRSGTLVFTHFFGAPVHINVYFKLAWDEERPLEVVIDEDGEVLREF